MSSPDTAPAEGSEALTLGQRLRRDREAAGRSLEELSAELHLSLERLRALEEDRFDELSGPAFVKGYLRAWARAVDGDAEQYLREYLRLEAAAPHWAPHEPVAVEDEPARRRLLWLSAALAALLVVLLLLWLWRGGRSEWVPASPPASVESIAPAAEPAAVDTVETGAPAAPEPVAGEAPAAPSAGDTTDGAPAEPPAPVTTETAGTGDATAGPATTAAAAGEPASAAASDGEESAAGAAPAEPPAAVVEPARPAEAAAPAAEASGEADAAAQAGTTPAQPAGAGPDRIEIEFNEDSWVEITDASQQMLLRGLFLAGARRELRGTAPFQVFLGNAPGVTLRFNGQDFDMAPFVRSNNTARFALVGDHSG